MSDHEHTFQYDDAGRMRCECGTYLFQHAPDHPYGVQAGPNGMYARWCLLESCDWRETGSEAPNRRRTLATDVADGLYDSPAP